MRGVYVRQTHNTLLTVHCCIASHINSAVEMLHDSALYKLMTDIGIDFIDDLVFYFILSVTDDYNKLS